MKKSSIVFVLGFCALNAEFKTEKSSQSFLFTRPIFQNAAMHNSFWHEAWFDNSKTSGVHLSAAYQKSFNSSKLKRYFLMANRDQLIIRGEGNGNFNNSSTDVRAEWLGLPTDFEGTLTIKPEQWQACWNLSIRKNFNPFGSAFFDKMWLFLEVPVVMINNNMHFAQTAVSNAATSGEVVDIVTAFNSSSWNYQKIRTSKKKVIRPAEVRVGFGSTFLSTDRAHVAMYSALSIPTYHKQNNKYLFEPQPGFNGHFASVSGASLQLPITKKDDPNSTCLFVNLETTYLIRQKEYRTFDLKNKEWSRFLLVRKNGQDAIPGVNALTRKVRVSSYAMIDALAGVRFNVGYSQAEFGFGVWGHTSERLKFINTWQELYGIAGSTASTSASASTILTRASNDASFTAIKETDLDVDSAKSLATVMYRAHVALGARGRNENSNLALGCGGFVEIPRNKTKGFSTWGAWAKLATAF